MHLHLGTGWTLIPVNAITDVFLILDEAWGRKRENEKEQKEGRLLKERMSMYSCYQARRNGNIIFNLGCAITLMLLSCIIEHETETHGIIITIRLWNNCI